jgi:hypothetical protein
MYCSAINHLTLSSCQLPGLLLVLTSPMTIAKLMHRVLSVLVESGMRDHYNMDISTFDARARSMLPPLKFPFDQPPSHLPSKP